MSGQGWMRVGSVHDVKPGDVIRVFADDEPVALANLNGELLAVGDVCSHEYVELHEGWIEDDAIECPQHGSRFDLRTGAVMGLPATRPIPVYEVKVDGEDVYVRGPTQAEGGR